MIDLQILGTYPFGDVGDNIITSSINDDGIKIINKLKGGSAKLYYYFLHLKGEDDLYVYFKDVEKYMADNNIKTIITVRSSLRELIQHKLIASTEQMNIYWVNNKYAK